MELFKDYKDDSPVKWSFVHRMWCFEHSIIYGPIIGSQFSSNAFHEFVKSCPDARVPLLFPRDPRKDSYEYFQRVAGEEWENHLENEPEADFYSYFFNQETAPPLTHDFLYTVHGKPASEQKYKSNVYMVHGVSLPPTKEKGSQVFSFSCTLGHAYTDRLLTSASVLSLLPVHSSF